jgi:hypothetical protein
MSSKPNKDKFTKSMKDKSEDDEPKCHIVLACKRKIVGINDVTDEEEYNKAEDMTPFTMDVETSIFLAQEDAP